MSAALCSKMLLKRFISLLRQKKTRLTHSLILSSQILNIDFDGMCANGEHKQSLGKSLTFSKNISLHAVSVKGAAVTQTKILAKNYNILFCSQQPLPKLPKIVLLKYFQICMYRFRENWKINLTIWYTVPRFNPQLFTISVKSKVPFQCRS